MQSEDIEKYLNKKDALQSDDIKKFLNKRSLDNDDDDDDNANSSKGKMFKKNHVAVLITGYEFKINNCVSEFVIVPMMSNEFIEEKFKKVWPKIFNNRLHLRKEFWNMFAKIIHSHYYELVEFDSARSELLSCICRLITYYYVKSYDRLCYLRTGVSRSQATRSKITFKADNIDSFSSLFDDEEPKDEETPEINKKKEQDKLYNDMILKPLLLIPEILNSAVGPKYFRIIGTEERMVPIDKTNKAECVAIKFEIPILLKVFDIDVKGNWQYYRVEAEDWSALVDVMNKSIKCITVPNLIEKTFKQNFQMSVYASRKTRLMDLETGAKVEIKEKYDNKYVCIDSINIFTAADDEIRIKAYATSGFVYLNNKAFNEDHNDF